MNNADFSRLVRDGTRNGGNGSPNSPHGTSSKTPPALGSRYRSSLGMTPRVIKGAHGDFQRQLAQQKSASQPAKKFRSSAAPKGTKLGAGYTDRSLERRNAERGEGQIQDEREARVQALEEQVKLGQLDNATFEKLRDEIVGGDVSTTHLVKGLDWRLLEKVRRGENLDSEKQQGKEAQLDEEGEFERLEQQEVTPVERKEATKKGEAASVPAPIAGQKRSRSDILAQWKDSRRAAAEAELNSKFGRQGGSGPHVRVEIDKKGREVLITTDEHGNVKRKVKKAVREAQAETATSIPLPTAASPTKETPKPLRMLGSPLPAPQEADDDDDIFAGVGDTYDPLGSIPQNDDSSEDEKADDETPPKQQQSPEPETLAPSSQASSSPPSPGPDPLATEPIPAQPPQPSEKRKQNNYFNDAPTATASRPDSKPLQDPTILAALQRAAAARKASSVEADGAPEEESAAVEAARQRILARQARDRADMDDLDMGFGESRGDDEAEAEEEGRGKGPRLSEWKGLGRDAWERDEGGKAGKGEGGKQDKKSRKKKKRKGNKESVDDVMRVLEARKKE